MRKPPPPHRKQQQQRHAPRRSPALAMVVAVVATLSAVVWVANAQLPPAAADQSDLVYWAGIGAMAPR